MEEQVFNVDLEKLKEWLVKKSEEMGRYDDEDGFSWGSKFAFEWVYGILTDEEDYKEMLNTLNNRIDREV